MSETEKLIIASQSKIRQKILKNANIEFIAINSLIDEESAKASMREIGMKPNEQAHELAKLKAQKVSNKYPNDYVLGCDQILSFENQSFDKVNSLGEAKEILLKLRRKAHKLNTAIVIYKNGQFIWRYDCAPMLKMRDFSNEFLDEYLQTAGEKILSSVGCYQLEDIGIQLFDEIDNDYFAILGLPILPLLGFLRLHGLVKL